METIEETLAKAKARVVAIDVHSLLDICEKLTAERKILLDGLKRVQGACTDKEMERRRLVAENKKLRATIEGMIEKLGCEEDA